MPVRSGVAFSSISGSSYRNPCPSGFSPGALVVETQFADLSYKNVTFLVCNPSSDSPADLGLALGLGLGLGIPVLALIISFIVCCVRRRKVAHHFEELIRDQRRANLLIEVQQREVVFEKLGFHLHKQFLAGNLTNELKVVLKTFSLIDLQFLQTMARKNSKLEIVSFIQSEIDTRNIPEPSAPPV